MTPQTVRGSEVFRPTQRRRMSPDQSKLRFGDFLRRNPDFKLEVPLPPVAPVRPVAMPSSYHTPDPLLMLVNRITQGFTVEQYARAQELGYDAYLEEQLAYDPGLVDKEMGAQLASFPTLQMEPKELYDIYEGSGQEITPALELMSAATLRSNHSSGQLYERMVEFWTNHFSINILDNQEIYFKTKDDREVIRPHALGKFPDLLRASAESGAMLYYLDNYSNTKFGIQENYARELMELHTMGVDGGYTEQDVKEVARCLTGWTLYGPASPLYGWFIYYHPYHDTGSKVVLGQHIPANGAKSDGDTVLDILANHPSTARYISTKMIRWLLTEEPSETLIDRITSIYLSTGGDIKAMIRGIFKPAELTTLANGAAPKFRRPWHAGNSMIRSLKFGVTDYFGYIVELFVLGHLPFTWPAPDGFPDSIDAWGSNLLPRWAFLTRLIGHEVPGVVIDIAGTTALLQSTGLPYAESMNWLFAGGTMKPSNVARIQQYLDDAGSSAWFYLREAVALAYQSPSLQAY